MISEPDPGAVAMRETRTRVHPRCVACGEGNPRGFQLRFRTQEDGSVSAEFHCRESVEGYRGVVHGGILSLLLDSAMTNCLFALGIAAMTAELAVRFREQVMVGREATVVARLVRRSGAGFVLEGAVIQDGRRKVTGRATFLKARDGNGFEATP